jgi:hypothetical protein
VDLLTHVEVRGWLARGTGEARCRVRPVDAERGSRVHDAPVGQLALEAELVLDTFLGVDGRAVEPEERLVEDDPFAVAQIRIVALGEREDERGAGHPIVVGRAIDGHVRPAAEGVIAH